MSVRGSAGLPASTVSGQHGEVSAVEWTQRSEVPLVEGRDTARADAVCDDDHAEVCESNVVLGVSPFQLEDDLVVVAVETGNGEASGREILEEGAPRARRPTRRPSK